MSMGGVDLLQRIRVTTSFLLFERTRGRVGECFTCAILAMEMSSGHLALSLCTEDVKAQYETLTPETRERLTNVLSQKEVDPTRMSLWRMLTVTSKSVEILSCVRIVTFL